MLNFKELLRLNTSANWVEYISAKATDMEPLRIDRARWKEDFDRKVTDLDLEIEKGIS